MRVFLSNVDIYSENLKWRVHRKGVITDLDLKSKLAILHPIGKLVSKDAKIFDPCRI